MESKKIFIGLSVPTTLLRDVAQSIDQIIRYDASAEYKMVKEFHLTLSYIGNVDKDSLPVINDVVSEVALRHNKIDDIMLTPVVDLYAQAVAIEVYNHEQLTALVDDLCTTIRERLKIDIYHDFKPHITVGRIRNKLNRTQQQELEDLLSNLDIQLSEDRFKAHEIHVYESRDGIYSILYSSELA